MDLEARMQWLEAEVKALRSRLDYLTGLVDKKVPSAAASGTDTRDLLMQLISEKVREASLDPEGNEQSLVLQAVVDRNGITYIGWATQEELRKSVDSEAIIQLASILASEARLRILQALATGERSAAEIASATGLEGGPLYHHLSELNEGGFLTQPSRGRYAMTRKGRDLYYQVALLVRTPYDQQPGEVGPTVSESS